jgi:hypothetical protein
LTATRSIPPLSNITSAELQMIDAYLATGSFSDAARLTGCHRNTVRRIYFRYQAAIREKVKEGLQGAQNSKDSAN